MSGTASVCAFYAFVAIVILATWRTSSWIGVDGVIRGFRQREHPSDTGAPALTTEVDRGVFTPSRAKVAETLNVTTDEPLPVG
jgi:hypothetical protein